MKKRKLMLTGGAGLLALSSAFLSGCSERSAGNDGLEVGGSEEGAAERRDSHEKLRNNIAHRGILVLDEIYRTTPAIRHGMIRALDDYRTLRSALESGDTHEANRAAERMRGSVVAVLTGDLRDKGERAWEQHAELYSEVLSQLARVATPADQRSYFAHLSEIAYCTVKSFGLGEALSNVYYCPMALEGKGAYWLAEVDAERNPYFASGMVGCVEQVEVLGP